MSKLGQVLLVAVVAVWCATDMCWAENRATSGKNDFVGTAVLMPNARRSRLSRDFVTAIADGSEALLPSVSAATVTVATPTTSRTESGQTVLPQDDSRPTVAEQQPLTDETYREYEHLLQMDTKNFSDKQKQLFDQIVERVARLSGGSDSPTTDPVDPEVGESRGSKQRLTKARLTSTSSPSSSASASTASKTKYASSPFLASTSTTKSKPASIAIKSNQPPASSLTTTTSAEPPKFSKFKPLHTNINPVSSSAATKVGNVTEVIFGNITTTSIVDSLSNDNGREDIFGKKRPATTAAAATVQTTADTNKNKVSARVGHLGGRRTIYVLMWTLIASVEYRIFADLCLQ